MPLLVLLLFLLFIPWIGFVLFFAMGFFLLMLVFFGFTGGSFLNIFTNPSRFFSVIIDKKARKNHALEHATSHVLAERGYYGATGEATASGFSIRGVPDPNLVYDASREALERLKSGESGLAIHRKCGTTVVIISTIMSLVFLSILVLAGEINIMSLILALFIAHLTGPVLSPWVQRYVTTDSNVGDLQVMGVELRSTTKKYLGAYVKIPDQVFISTVNDSGVIEAEVV